MSGVKLYKVKVKSTGKIIFVYKLLLGGYCDSNDHTTPYAEANLEFIDNDNNNDNTKEQDKPNKVFRFKDEDNEDEDI